MKHGRPGTARRIIIISRRVKYVSPRAMAGITEYCLDYFLPRLGWAASAGASEAPGCVVIPHSELLDGAAWPTVCPLTNVSASSRSSLITRGNFRGLQGGDGSEATWLIAGGDHSMQSLHLSSSYWSFLEVRQIECQGNPWDGRETRRETNLLHPRRVISKLKQAYRSVITVRITIVRPRRSGPLLGHTTPTSSWFLQAVLHREDTPRLARSPTRMPSAISCRAFWLYCIRYRCLGWFWCDWFFFIFPWPKILEENCGELLRFTCETVESRREEVAIWDKITGTPALAQSVRLLLYGRCS